MGRLAVIWGFAVATLLLVETAFRRWPQTRLPNNTYLLMEYQKDKIATINEDTVILIGDSSLGQNVHAATLEELLDINVCNLALNGTSTTVGDYYLVKELVRRRREHVRAVVIKHTADIWRRSIDEDARKGLRMRFAALNLEALSWRTAHFMALVQQSSAYKDYLLRPRYGISPYPENLVRSATVAEQTRQLLAEHDYTAQRKRRNWDKREGRNLGSLEVNAQVDRWFEKTLELCQKEGIPVLLANGPIWEETALESLPYVFELVRWQAEKAEKYDSVYLMYPSVPMIPSAQCGDSQDHVSYEAKQSYTVWFARQLIDKREVVSPDIPESLVLPPQVSPPLDVWELLDLEEQ